MCFQTKPTGFSKNKYFRRNKGFAGNTRYWKQGSTTGFIKALIIHSAQKLSYIIFDYCDIQLLYLSIVRQSVQVFFQSEKAVASVYIDAFFILLRVDGFVQQRDRLFIRAFVVALFGKKCMNHFIR